MFFEIIIPAYEILIPQLCFVADISSKDMSIGAMNYSGFLICVLIGIGLAERDKIGYNNSDEFINYINSLNTTWKVNYTAFFSRHAKWMVCIYFYSLKGP